jgi:hypothetical protein
MLTQYDTNVSNILQELFNTQYPVVDIRGVTPNNRSHKFNDFNIMLAYHIKHRSSTPINMIQCYFSNKNNETIELTMRPSEPAHTILDDDHVPLTVEFHLQQDFTKLMLNSFDANVVASTTMHIMLDYAKALHAAVSHTTNDWIHRAAVGIYKFTAYPNISINKVSRQIRSDKERTRGSTQREDLYTAAFDKVIKPVFPSLSIHKQFNAFIIKS